MLRLAVVCAVSLAGCQTTEVVALRLEADSACGPTDFAEVQTLSIEAFAQDGQCKLAHSCVFNIDATDESDLEASLRSAGDVLLDLPADEVQVVSVNGRPRNDCFPRTDDSNEPTLCGSANVASSVDGELTVVLQCGIEDCIETLELCP